MATAHKRVPCVPLQAAHKVAAPVVSYARLAVLGCNSRAQLLLQQRCTHAGLSPPCWLGYQRPGSVLEQELVPQHSYDLCRQGHSTVTLVSPCVCGDLATGSVASGCGFLPDTQEAHLAVCAAAAAFARVGTAVAASRAAALLLLYCLQDGHGLLEWHTLAFYDVVAHLQLHRILVLQHTSASQASLMSAW